MSTVDSALMPFLSNRYLLSQEPRLGRTNLQTETDLPLAVDIDGSLLRSDLLMETFFKAIAVDFFATLALIMRSLFDRPKLKAGLAAIAQLDLSLQPVNEEVLAYCRKWRGPVVLASASDLSLVEALAAQHGFADRHFGTTAGANLKGRKKAERLVDEYGEQGFVYIGNAISDLKVWRHAAKVVAVSPNKILLRKIEALGKPVTTLRASANPKKLLRGARPHQWVKNLLLLLPTIANHDSDLDSLWTLLLAFLAFSFAASSIYYVNDLLDLEADRKHDTKRFRALASGAVSIPLALAFTLALMATSISLSAVVGPAFLAVVLIYMASSLAYSFKIKRLRWVDIIFLAGLYTLRVIAGGLAVGIGISGWLVSFVFAVFFALGAVKRMTELAKAKTEGRVPGRGYAKPDLDDLLNIAVTAAVGAILIFGIYTYSDTARALYPNLWELRLAGGTVAIWLSRMIWLGYKGRQDYDPIVFAATDKIGLGIAATGLLLLLHAAAAI